MTRKRKLDHERIIELSKKGLTSTQIANRMGCLPSTAARIIKMHKQAKEAERKEGDIA